MKSNLLIMILAVVIIFSVYTVTSYASFGSESKVYTETSVIVKKIQERYSGLAGLSADFRQTLLSSDTGTSISETGSLVFKKGGYMRWDYKEPEEKLFICDGRDCYLYIPEENLVQVFSLGKMDPRSTPMLFFTGKGDLSRDFDAELLTGGGVFPSDEKHYRLKLKPKGEQEQFDYLIAVVNTSTYFIERMLVVDLLGNQTDYIFESVRETEPVPDSFFKFSPPKDAEIVRIEE